MSENEHSTFTQPQRDFERHAADILRMFPGAQMTRTRDALQIDVLGDHGIVLLLTPEALELRLPTVDWTEGSHGPAASSRLWKRVLWRKVEETEVGELCSQALEVRHNEFRRCRYCGQLVPRERRIQGDVCHACAQKHGRVVF